MRTAGGGQMFSALTGRRQRTVETNARHARRCGGARFRLRPSLQVGVLHRMGKRDEP